MLVTSLRVLPNHAERSEGSAEGLKYSSKKVDEDTIRLTEEAFLRSFRRSSSSILSNPLLNIFYSFRLRKRFYSRRRFSFNYLVRASLLAASQAASASSSSFSSRSKALLIPSKLTTGSAGSHFFLVRIYSEYFRESDDNRYSLYLVV